MTVSRLVGPGAGSEKYDLLTALAVIGLSGTPGFQTSMMRLIALITARYNWLADEVTIGQRELASLWNVDERTAKREVKRLLATEMVLLKRAGVRGRVASYRLDLPTIYAKSQTQWGAVGPDYASRMTSKITAQSEKVVRVDFRPAPSTEPAVHDPSPWGRVRQLLESEDPVLFASWFTKIELEQQLENALILRAPSQFIAKYVMNNLSDKLNHAVERSYARPMGIRVTV